MRTRSRAKRALLLVVACVGIGVSACGGKLVASIAIPQTEGTGESQVSLAGGSTVDFPVKAARASSTEAVNLELHVELLRGTQVVGKLDCAGFRMRGVQSKAGAWELNDGCRTTVPAGGASGVRATTRLSRRGAATFQGLVVEVRQPG